MSQLKVNAISDAAGANGNAITLATDGSCIAKVTNNLSNRNLIINGAFNLAQRSASSTSGGYASVDRFKVVDNNTNVTITQSQHALTSSDTGPWAKGFRKSWKQELSAAGNGLDGTTYLYLVHLIEGQDIANSGWDYTSASSYITLSFWFKASTNQTFYGRVMSNDGTTQNYPFSFTATGNDTWTKITKTIPGASNNQIDNDNTAGFKLEIALYAGADRTDSGVSLNTWAAYASGTRIPDMANTWITAGTSSFELTGVQLEVSDYATDFEHRTYGDELLKCQRYFTRIGYGKQYAYVISGIMASTTQPRCHIQLPTTMRAAPTASEVGSLIVDSETAAGQEVTAVVSSETTKDGGRLQFACNTHSAGAGQSIQIYCDNATSGLDFSAEL